MNDFQSTSSGKGLLKDNYASSLDAALKKKRLKLAESLKNKAQSLHGDFKTLINGGKK